MMTATVEPAPSLWARIPTAIRAIISGLSIGLIAANVWPQLLAHFGAARATLAELVFFAAYLWWASGGGPPRALKTARAVAFRSGAISARQWRWGLFAAVCIAVSVHAAMVVLFKLVPFPAELFHRGYDFSFVPGMALRWVVIVISAASAGICEETGFRGYMQRPIELRHGAVAAILTSSVFFTLLHLNQAWAIAGMLPIAFGAGLFYGTLAWAGRSLVFGMIGHTIMDIGLFAFWWSGTAGTFTTRPISETGIDALFVSACAVLFVAVVAATTALVKLRAAGRDQSH